MSKGFTLIELLAVIVILAIIATITLFSTGIILKDTKESISETQKSRLVEAAKMYYLSHSSVEYVCVSTLVDEGLLDTDVVLDPKDKHELDGYVSITKSGNKIRYEYDESDTTLCE